MAKSKKLPSIPAWDEIDRLLRATTRQRDRLLLLLAAFCGLRVSELVALAVEDLDLRRQMVFVRQGKGAKDRVVPLPRFLVGPFRGWLGPRAAGPVFPSRQGGAPMSTRAVRYLVKRVAAAAGLRDADKPRRISPHSFRHAAASRWLEVATIAEVRDLLGHSSIAVTDRYVHANPIRLAEVVNR